MLKSLRDSMKYLAWILWAVIAVFVLFVFVDFGTGVPQPGSPTRAAATVGGEEVTYLEFEREYRELEEQMRSRLGEQLTPELAEQLRLPMQALDRIINRKILLAEARRLDLQVTDQELQRAILELPAFTDEAGQFVGAQAYEGFLRRMGYTSRTFEEAMRDQILVSRLLGAVGQAVVVTEDELEERHRQQVEQARIRYLTLPFESLRPELEVTDADLERYFAEHAEDFRVPQERVAQYLLVDQRQLRDTLELPEAELRSFYEQHRAEYAETEQVRARHVLVRTEERSDEEARARAEQARRRIAGGEPFEAVAQELSDDPGSAARGGDLGFFGRGRMVPAFEEAAFGAPVGELVGPVQTSFGYHLVEVLERREARQRPFEEVQELLRARLAAERATALAEQRAEQIHQRLTQQGAATPEALQALAEEDPALEQGTTQPFRAQGAVMPLGNAPGLNDAAFSLAEGGISPPVRTPRGWVILRLAEVRPERSPALAEVREEVRLEVEREELQQLAVARLERARAGGDLAHAAGELGLEVQESQSFGHGGFVGGLGFAPAIVEAALEADEGALLGPLPHEQGAVLFEVAERQRFTPEGFAAARDGLRAELAEEKLNQAVAALVQQRRRELGVRYDRQLLESWNLQDEV